MFRVSDTERNYLNYAHSLNVQNIKMFSLAVCVICLLLYFTSGDPNPDIKFSAIINGRSISIFFSILFLLNWSALHYIKDKIEVQKRLVWSAVLAAYLFAGSLSYLSLADGGGITAVAVAYLMISVLFAERLIIQLSLLFISCSLFMLLVFMNESINFDQFRVALISVMLLSVLISIAMDRQRRSVFNNQQKIAEQLENLNKALDVKAAFFGHMSHELRTPLNAIIGFSDMLKILPDEKLDVGRVNEYADFINKGGHHLLSLVNDLLDQNKIEAGEINVTIEKLNIGELLTEYVDELKPISINKDQEIQLVVKDNIFIESDRRLFKQIIYNLLSNAQKYTQNNGTIVIGANMTQDGMAQVNIIDNGKGMSEEVAKQIGNLDLTIKSHFISHAEGTGLGLIIVQQLIYRLNAAIDVKSKVGVGTEITLLFPKKITSLDQSSS